MKKKVMVLSIVGIVLFGLGLGLFICNPFIFKGMVDGTLYTVDDMFVSFGGALKLMFLPDAIPLATWVAIGIGGFFLILWIIHLVILIAKKHPIAVWQSVAWLLVGAVCFFLFYLLLFRIDPQKVAASTKAAQEYSKVLAEYPSLARGQGGYFPAIAYAIEGGGTGVVYESDASGYFGYAVRMMTEGRIINAGVLVLLLAPFLLIVVGAILLIVSHISDMVYIVQDAERKSVEHDDYGIADSTQPVVVIHDDETNDTPNADQIRAIMHDELEENEAGRPAAAAPAPGPVQGSVSTTGFSGPFLIQYINTYNPGETRPVEKAVSPKEVEDNINGEKNLSADDIRRIIKEELDAKNEPAQPVIVTVPSNEGVNKEKPLSAEDIRAIIKEEMSVKEEDVIVEEMEEEPKPLSAEDIRNIIREELAPKEEEELPEEEEEDIEIMDEKDIRDIIKEELAAFHAVRDEEAAKKAEEEAAKKAAEEEAARKAEEERLAEEAKKAEEEKKAAEARKVEEEAERERKDAMLSAEDIRAIIAEELAKTAPKEEEKPEEEDFKITAEAIRDIIRSELKAVEPVKEEPVEEPAPEPVKEEPKEEVAPQHITVVVNNPAPVEEPKPEPVVVEVAPAPAPAPAEDPAKKIERIPFPTRMLTAEKELQNNYNVLKNEIMSYGVKSRVSNSGDTFRLHKVTYVKITIAGKGLKLYFALDPKDYANSPIPVQDAGHKGIYEEIPAVFKVKSELSVRRALQLIADTMEKAGIEQGKKEEVNWVKELVDFK